MHLFCQLSRFPEEKGSHLLFQPPSGCFHLSALFLRCPSFSPSNPSFPLLSSFFQIPSLFQCPTPPSHVFCLNACPYPPSSFLFSLRGPFLLFPIPPLLLSFLLSSTSMPRPVFLFLPLSAAPPHTPPPPSAPTSPLLVFRVGSVAQQHGVLRELPGRRRAGGGGGVRGGEAGGQRGVHVLPVHAAEGQAPGEAGRERTRYGAVCSVAVRAAWVHLPLRHSVKAVAVGQREPWPLECMPRLRVCDFRWLRVAGL